MTGWVKRRSTRTTTVLSCLSLTTTPWSMRFGISDYSGLAFERVARFGLAAGSFLRRPAGTLLRRDRLDSRDVTANLPNPRSVLELPRRPLEAQVEPLFLEFEGLVVELVDGHGPKVTRLHDGPTPRCAR